MLKVTSLGDISPNLGHYFSLVFKQPFENRTAVTCVQMGFFNQRRTIQIQDHSKTRQIWYSDVHCSINFRSQKSETVSLTATSESGDLLSVHSSVLSSEGWHCFQVSQNVDFF